ncbi:MAG: ORF6N domain-containing protein [Chitinophagaceae bacterium]
MTTKKKKPGKIIPGETIIGKIFVLRGHKIMLDTDLAVLYEVETKILNQAVKRNASRFPADFMFRLNKKEFESLRSQFVTSNRGGSRYMPYAFTEQGVAMLSGVINSTKAIKMNIAIMRAFVEIRRIVMKNTRIANKLKSLEERLGEHDIQLNQIYNAIENLMNKKIKEESWQDRRRIGFK